MRVTGGSLKGRIIPSNFANHVRPSTDRVRESLFNSLDHQKGIADAHVLDLFSGSGIIALEFLTREAQSVFSIDLDKKNIAHQKHIAQTWNLPQWHIATGNALTPTQTLLKSTRSIRYHFCGSTVCDARHSRATRFAIPPFATRRLAHH
jgi:16S rRNA (guanine(966)-N(2))-methyltransferase RsmD